MKNYIIFSMLVLSLISAGCSAPADSSDGSTSSSEGQYSVDKSIQGLWYKFGTTTTINLGNRTDYEITILEPDLIQIKEKWESYYSSGYTTFYAVRYGDQSNKVKVKVNTIGGTVSKTFTGVLVLAASGILM